MTTATDDHGDGGRVERAALDHVAGGSKVGHIGVGRLADFDGGQGAEAAASRPTAPASSGGAGLDLADRTAAASPARRARSTTARPDTHCDHCGRRMSPGRHGRRRYCSNGCRQSAYKRRRRAAAAVEGVTDGKHG